MTRRKPRLAGILAGTALVLLMAAPAGAMPAGNPFAGDAPRESLRAGGFLLIQDEGDQEAQPEEDGEAKPRERRKRERREAGEEAEQGGAQEEKAAEETPRQRRRREAAEQPERQEAQPKQAEEQPEQAGESPRERRKRESQEAEQQRQQNEQQNNEADEQSARQQRQREREALANGRQNRDAGGGSSRAAPEPEQAAEPEQAEESPRQRRQREKQEAEQRQAEQQKAEQRQAEQRKAEQQAAEEQAEKQQAEKQREQAERERQQQEAAPEPGQAEESPRDRRRREQREAEQQAEQERQQRAESEDRNGGESRDALPPGEASSTDAEQRATPEDGQPVRRPRREQAEDNAPPADDRAAQEEVRPERLESVNAEEGTGRREIGRDEDEPQRRERPRGTDVLREIGDRLILRYDDQVRVESNDAPRMQRNARDVYVEDLPRQRTRETVTRPDGTRVVTIRNRFGDVIRRSRITEDGREYVLNYVDEEDTDRERDWRDPGLDLPPFRSDVPERDYILDAEQSPTAEDYYDFLEKPPVERVERLYSLDEVKRSARVRQKTRRVDLDTVTFEFGSAAVPESEINKLDGVASAMERLLKKNPAETFLIEGHTDAVGSDEANLALSDRRAEAVAEALTSVFEIPPENLATQGYGEQYLKVNTSSAERENRRVAIRRITPLVAPVASAN